MTLGTTLLILVGWALAAGSPGPATMAISGTSMAHGRKAGLTIASGVVCGSASWGVAAGLGVSAIMLANVWLFELVRYAGAAYLLFLAFKSMRRALQKGDVPPPKPKSAKDRFFLKGFLLHLTNPKAILGWGAIYAIALPTNAGPTQVWTLFGLLIITSGCMFWGYGYLFSSARISAVYVRLRRWFEGAFALLFGVASLKLLTARIV